MGSQRRLLPRQARLIAALLLAAGCSSGDTEAAAPTTAPPCSTIGEGEDRVDLGDRWYLRHVPPAHDGAKAVPLVVDLHGYSEGAVLHAAVTGLGEYGDDEGFVTVTPHALGDPPAWDITQGGIDVAFVADVIEHAKATLCIDPDRVYVTGHSMGGFLISALACTTTVDDVAAFAPVAGARDVDCDEPSPVLVIHGTADDVVLFGGGLHPGAADILDMPADGPSITDIVEDWAERNGCTVSGIDYDCPTGREVELHTIEGGSHEWPRRANDLIWAFFEQHRR